MKMLKCPNGSILLFGRGRGDLRKRKDIREGLSGLDYPRLDL